MAIKDKDLALAGYRPLIVDSTGLHAAPADITLTTGSYTADATYGDMFGDCSGGNITVALPAAASYPGRVFRAFKTDISAAATGGGYTLTVNGTVMGSNTGVSVIEWKSNGTAWKLARLYEEGTFTATLTGCTTSPTVTALYTRTGKAIDLNIPAVTATSNSVACTFTGLPSHIQAGRTWQIGVPEVEDAGLFNLGSVQLTAASGTITLYRVTGLTTGNTNVFTNSATVKGASSPICISYTTQ